jgi:hypothetical protein
MAQDESPGSEFVRSTGSPEDPNASNRSSDIPSREERWRED